MKNTLAVILVLFLNALPSHAAKGNYLCEVADTPTQNPCANAMQALVTVLQQCATAPSVSLNPTTSVNSTITSGPKYTKEAYKYLVNSATKDVNAEIYPECYVKVKLNEYGYQVAKRNADSLRLWMNGLCFKKLKPLFVTADSALIFKMFYDTAATCPWQVFYSYPNYLKKFKHEVSINAGTEKEMFASTPATTLKLTTTQAWMVWLAYGIFIFVLVAVIRLRKGALRSTTIMTSKGITISMSEPSNPDGKIINIKDVPYSIAKVQLLLWLLIVFLSILHIWGYLDTLATPTGSVLLLIGISGGTFYLGNLIDSSATAADDTAAADFIRKIIAGRSELKSKIMFDILSDGQTISLHRLQLFMFTLFLGIYFIWYVLYNLQMPQFSDTMMALMGISGSTYAGLKTLEKP
jgi:hypothetical protein